MGRTREAKTARPRYKNWPFLKALGEHCRQLRQQRSYSIDRMSKESDQLSPAAIDRLERGLADTQILVLVRYADVLGLTLADLFSFTREFQKTSLDERIIPYEVGMKTPSGHVPVYPLKVAAGAFSENHLSDYQPIGWVDAGVKGSSDYFASFVIGQSMEPRIPDKSLCLFKKYSGGSRQGKVFLIQSRGPINSETGDSFVVKKYVRQTPPRQSEDSPAAVHLVSENPRFSPIILLGKSDDEIQTVAEFIRVL